MIEQYITEETDGISPKKLREVLHQTAEQYPDARKVLIIPPDFTRCFSYGGEITKILYEEFSTRAAVYVMPALGNHAPMSKEERKRFFGNVIPDDAVLIHHWKTDTIRLGCVPAEFCSRISGGRFTEDIEAEVNHLLFDGGFDVIFSVGQVVPHEVVGMANYSKNIFVGTGGRGMINKSHMLGALCNMEKIIGLTNSPTRQLFDYAQQHFLDGKIPLVYVQTVTTRKEGAVRLNGLFIGPSRIPYEKACALSQKLNIVYTKRPARKVVCYLDPDEMKTTWISNKGIYRTRMIVADGGELIMMAPGIRSFGENPENDAIIRRYGYRGTEYVLKLYHEGAFDGYLMCAAHLIHGSSEGRFRITYATRPENLSRSEIESVGYQWADYNDMVKLYNPAKLKDGWNTLENGEEIYYVSTPAIGLWKVAP